MLSNSINSKASRAEREGDYGKVAELRYGKIKEAEQRIEVVKKKISRYETW